MSRSRKTTSSDASTEELIKPRRTTKKTTKPVTNKKPLAVDKPKYKGKLQPKDAEQDDSVEAPECYYNIPADKLVKVLQRTLGVEDHKTFAKIFTALRQYEDYSVLNEPKKLTKKQNEKMLAELEENHQTTPDFDEKIVKALFWLPKKKGGKGENGKTGAGAYEYLRVRLAPSNIKAAGIGAYAVDPIPKGARGVYKGVPMNEDTVNMYYAWTVKSFDAETGEVDEDDDEMYYIDAFDTSKSNWTRYVNCGMKDRYNNFESDQLYDKFFYVALKDAEPGEELFIDYGDAYRQDNLGMTGKY